MIILLIIFSISLGASGKEYEFLSRDANGDVTLKTHLSASMTPDIAAVAPGTLFNGQMMNLHFLGDAETAQHEIECEVMIVGKFLK